MENNNIPEVNGEKILQITKELCDFGYRRSGTPAADKAEKILQELDYISLALKKKIPLLGICHH